MASAFQRLWNLSQFSHRLSISVRYSSGLSNIIQREQCIPVGVFACKSIDADHNGRKNSQEISGAFLSSLLVGYPIIEKGAPPIKPYGPQRRFDLPTIPTHMSFEMPTVKSLLDKVQITPDKIKIEAPQHGPIVEKSAHRMLVIRRRKMKKHQLKKFRRKFRVLLMTVKQRRNSRKEVAFLNEILGNIMQAEAFDPKEYVRSKLKRAYEPLPEKPEFLRPMPWEFQPIFAASKKKK